MIKWFVLTLLLVPGTALSLEAGTTIGAVAERLIIEGSVVTNLMHFVCVVVGVILFIIAGAQYKAHRANPKFVPLERPIIYILLGVILIALPFLGRLLAPTGSAEDLKKESALRRGVQIHDIDAPLHETDHH